MSDVGSKPLWKARAPHVPSVGSPDGFYEAALRSSGPSAHREFNAGVARSKA